MSNTKKLITAAEYASTLSVNNQQINQDENLYNAALNQRLEFCRSTKHFFPLELNKWTALAPSDVLKLRTEIDSLLIIYDQLVESEKQREILKQQVEGLRKKCVELNNNNIELSDIISERDRELNAVVAELEKAKNKTIPLFPKSVIDSTDSEREYLFKRLLVAGIPGRNLITKQDQNIFTDQMFSIADAAINTIKKARK